MGEIINSDLIEQYNIKASEIDLNEISIELDPAIVKMDEIIKKIKSLESNN